MEEKRALHRISNKYGSDLSAIIKIKNKKFVCSIRDYNSNSAAIVTDKSLIDALLKEAQIAAVEIFLGKESIGAVINPMIIKIDPSANLLVLQLQTLDVHQNEVRDFRSKVPLVLMGVCIGPDPLKLAQLINFQIINISTSGFLAKSSRSNRHILPGLKMTDFQITLPGSGALKLSFIVRHVSVIGDSIQFGCQFINLSPTDRKIIDGYQFICAHSVDPDEAYKIAREKKLPLKEFVRIERVSSSAQLDQVLNIRFSSYKSANKLKADVTTYDMMKDQYDDQSIILAAFLGAKMVGTIRIVFSTNGSKFPFEELFPMPSKINRDDLVEVSRLAILPVYQGSDIIIKLFQGFAFEYISKKRFALCMSTKKLSKYYTSIGARKISKPLPHPTLENDTLTCYLFDRKRLEAGKMRATAWYLFARETISSLSKFGLAKKVRFSLRLRLMKSVEKAYLKLKNKDRS
jgi:hypothetical protein